MDVTLFRNLRGASSYSMERYADELGNGLKQQGVNVRDFSISAARLPLLKHYFSKEVLYPIAARKEQGEVNQVIDHSYGSLVNALDARRTVVTCHDLNCLEYGKTSGFLGRQIFKWNLKAMQKACKVIAGSYHTKQDLLKHTSIEAENIAVIHEAASENFGKLKKKPGAFAGKKIVLSVGSAFPQKNFEGIVRAVKEAEEATFLLKFGEVSKKQLAFAKSVLGERLVYKGRVSEDELVKAYNAAHLLLFPSFHEGFGFPVLEAMQCGCAVVCSNTSSLPEVAGEAAYYVNPWKQAQVNEAVAKVLEDDPLRREMQGKGLKQAKKFSWSKAAKQTIAVYENVLRR